MIVQTLKRHRATGEPREVGTTYHVNPTTARHLIQCGLVRKVADRAEWHTPQGRELRTEPLADRRWPQVVACLNIWNDRAALERTLPSWLDRVDALVVADGAYAGMELPDARSTDGLHEWLAGAFHMSTRKPMRTLARETWADQQAKRSALLRAAAEDYPDALLLIVDADEYVSGPGDLHDAPEGDVLWVAITSPLYQRPYGQPRLIRAQPDLEYRGRHHWLYAGDRLLATHQYGGVGLEHRLAPITMRNERGLGHTAARSKAKAAHAKRQMESESLVATPRGAASDRAVGARESLRIAALASYDPGMVGFRLHTALNTTTPHASVFFRQGQDNPFQAPRQYDVDEAPEFTRECLGDADVVHCHLNYAVLDATGVKPKAVVIHHHGTWLRQHAATFARQDAVRANLRLVSNLELLKYGENLHWLPNPVSVARLRRLRRAGRFAMMEQRLKAGLQGGYARLQGGYETPFRVAHSPSKRELKGTTEFLTVCDRLQRRGVLIEPVLIEGQSHAESLRLKATCDAAFDSFWLGLQCSGLEAAGMGLPVIAGDAEVRDRYLEHVGHVPYTFAADEAELEAALERLVMDHDWREAEARRVSDYTESWHDDAAVALRYLDLLDEAIGWRQQQTLPVSAKRRKKVPPTVEAA